MSDPQNPPMGAPPPPPPPAGPPPAPPPPAAPPPPPPPMAPPAGMGPPPTYVTGAPPPYAAPAAPNFLSTMSQGELLIAVGAVVVILADLIFGIFGPYGFSNVIWAGAVLALLMVLFRRRLEAGMPWMSTGYAAILGAIAALIVLVGIRNLVVDVIFLSRGVTPMFLLGMLALYVGVGLIAAGAWMLWQGRAR